MKKIFAVLAITEIFVFILWAVTCMLTEKLDNSEIDWPLFFLVHLWAQVVMIILFYLLSLRYIKPRIKYKTIFFVTVTFLTIFGLVVTSLLAETLLSSWAYLEPVTYVTSAWLTLIICVAAYSKRIYRSLAK